MRGKLLLKCRIPLLHVGSATEIVIGLRSNLGDDGNRVHGRKRPCRAAKRDYLCCAIWKAKSRSDNIEMWIYRLMKDSVRPPQCCPAVAKHIPRKPNSRIDVPGGRVVSEHMRHMLKARRNTRLRRTAIASRIVRTSERIQMGNVVKIPLSFNWVRYIVVPDAEVERQSPRHSPVVLDKCGDVSLPAIAYGGLIA